ncbi:MAG: iron-containing alcohol dehydrogenase [Pirellulales bacterium]
MPESSRSPAEPPAAALGLLPYELTMPPRVIFGPGRVADVGRLAATHGEQVWLVTGRTSFAGSGAREPLLAGLQEAGLPHREVACSAGEPTVDQLAAALAVLPADRSGVVVVAVGGGATIDLAKALAALATNVAPCDATAAETAVIDRLEGVGRSLPISRAPLPVVAVPTTAGTGAEATRNAVISCPRRRFKKSLRSPLMVPRVAVLDPDLTGSCSRETVAAAGLDCLTQLIESFISRRRWSLPQALVLEAFPRAFSALPRVLADPADEAARAALLHAAFISGVSLGNSGLGLAHGVAAALGVECGTPHGLACAVMLPVALRVNRHESAAELARLDAALGGSRLPQAEAVARLIDRVDQLCNEAGIPRSLSALGLSRNRLEWLAENSGGNSMRGNPVQLATADLCELLESAF